MAMEELDLRTALAEVYPPDKFHKPVRRERAQTQSRLARRRAAAPLPTLKTSFDDNLLAIKSPISPSHENAPMPPRIQTSRPSTTPESSGPPAGVLGLKSEQSSKSSLSSIFGKPNVERARGYNEAGLRPARTGLRPLEQSSKSTNSRSLRSFQSKDITNTEFKAPANPRLQARPSARLRPQPTSPVPDALAKRSPDHIQHKLGAAWEAPTLPAAYPQALKHTVLENADWCMGTLPKHKARRTRTGETLERSKKKSGTILKPIENISKVSVGGTSHHNGDHGDADGKIHSVFVLVTSGYLLEYAAEGAPERKPERILKLSTNSAAFVSDQIPGRYYVLHVLEDAASETVHRVGQAPRKSLFSKIFPSPRLSRRRTCPSILLVFDSPGEMNDWMRAIRGEIDMLNGRPARPQTATIQNSPEAKEERPSAPLHRALTITKGQASDSSSLGKSTLVSPPSRQPGYVPRDVSTATASDRFLDEASRRLPRARDFNGRPPQLKLNGKLEDVGNVEISPPSSASTPLSPISPSSSSEQRQDTASSSFDVSPLSDEVATRTNTANSDQSPDLTSYTPTSTPISQTFSQSSQTRKASLVSSASDDRLARRSQRYNLYPSMGTQRRSFTPSGPPNTPLPLTNPVLPREPLSPIKPPSIAEESDTEDPEDVPPTLKSFGHSPRSPYFSHRTPESIPEGEKITTPTDHFIGNKFAQSTPTAAAASMSHLPSEELPYRPLPFRSSTIQQRQSQQAQSIPDQQWPLRRTSRMPAPLPLRVLSDTKSSTIHPLRSSPNSRSSFVPHTHLESLSSTDPSSFGLAISTDHRTSLVNSDSRTTALQSLIGDGSALAQSSRITDASATPADTAKRASQTLKRPPSIQVNTDSAPFLTAAKSNRTLVGSTPPIGTAVASEMPNRSSSTRVPIVRPRSIRPGGVTGGVRPRRSTPSLPPLAPPPDVPLPPPPTIPAQITAQT